MAVIASTLVDIPANTTAIADIVNASDDLLSVTLTPNFSANTSYVPSSNPTIQHVFGFVDRSAGADIGATVVTDRIADRSLEAAPGVESFGILSSTETDMVFAMGDTNLGNGNAVTYEASFAFDISSATSLSNIQMSFAASGDFEDGTSAGDTSDDRFEVVARIDGGAEFVVFASEVDEANFDGTNELAYPQESGVTFSERDPLILLDDATGTTRPLTVGATGTGPSLSQFTSNSVAGQSGNVLELIVRANINSTELVIFDDVIINGETTMPTTLSVSFDDAAISENGGTTTGTVTRVGDTSGALTVDLSSNDTGEATVPATVSFAAGASTATFTVTGVDDATFDGDQTVSITASSAEPSVTGGSNIITVADDELPPLTFDFPSGNQIAENGGTRPVTITRTGDTTNELVATLTSSAPGEVSVPMTVTFAAGSATATFDVTGIDDDLFEFNETVQITASAAGFADSTTDVVVTSEDAFTSSMEITETSSREDAGTITGTFTHNLANGNILTAELTSSDTSEATVPLSLTFHPGEFSRTFDITLIDDGINDGDQTVTISASSASGALLGSDTITVVDVNLPLEVAFDAPSVREDGGTVSGTVTRPGDTTDDLVVTLASTDSDEAVVPASVTIAAGEATADFLVTGVDDAQDDGTQTVTITASAAGQLSGTQTLDVIDNDVVIDTRMPALAVNYSFQNMGVFPGEGDTSSTPLGTINTFAFTQELGLDTNGDLLSIAPNSSLFSLTGTSYGGDGLSTFGLPDLEGMLAVGDGNGTGLTPRDTGDTFGSDDVSLTQINSPASLGGTSSSASNVEESQVINYYIATTGVFPTAGSGASQGFLGQMIAHVGELGFSEGWVKADGRLLQISENSALFSIIGTTYGGDGRVTFALPDLQGRVPIGAGRGPGLDSVNLGQELGSENFNLINDNLPASVGGNGTAIDNYQPSLGINYLVSLSGLFPNSTTDGSEFMIGQIVPFAGNFAPAGFALAHGQLLSISENTALFSLIGTFYGGDGRTNFALPDLRGRALIDENGGAIRLGDELGSPEFSITDVPYAPIPAVTAISEDTGTPGDGTTSDTTLEISGTAVAGAVVEIFLDGASIGTATADMNGDWTFDYTGTVLATGSYTITATALVNGIVSNPSSSFALEIEPPLTLTVTLDDTEIPEDGGATTGTVTRSGDTSADLVVTLASDDETEATVPATVTILAGETSATFAVAAGTTDALLDRLDGDQTATITASAAGFPDGTADITVTESHFTVVNTPAETSIAEGQSTTVTVTRGGDISAAATYDISVLDATEISAPATVSFAAGEATATFSITGVLDGELDGDRISGATASPTSLFAVVSTSAVVVTDIDVPSLTVTVPTPLGEGAAGGLGTVTRNGDTSSAVTVSLSSSDVGSLTVPASVIIDAGETQATFFVSPVDDDIVDGDQVVTITATGAGLADGTFDVTLQDDDLPTLTVTLDDASISENGGTTTGTVTHNLASVSPFSVNLSSSDTGEATVPATVSFASGSRTATFTVTAVDDPDFDGDQTVTITAASSGFADGASDITIVNDDNTALSVSFADPSISENGGTTTGTVTRVGDTTDALEVTLASNDTGEATVPGTVTILAGEASADFVINAVNDADDDDDQTVTIEASATGA